MPPTSLFVQPTRCGLIRFYRRIYGIAPASLCERRGGFQLSLSANALAMYVMVSFSSWVCFGFCFSASRSRCLSWKGKRLRAMTHRMPTTSPRLVAIQEMMTTGDSLSVWMLGSLAESEFRDAQVHGSLRDVERFSQLFRGHALCPELPDRGGRHEERRGESVRPTLVGFRSLR